MILTNSEIKTIVESAFRPLRCVSEFWDYDQKLRFKVFGPDDKGIVEAPELALAQARERTHLHETITLFRERVKEKGLNLQPWSLS